MMIQKSFEQQEKGSLFVVPTPIGNLEDITYRALSTLKEVAIIAAEDTRNTKKLLHHFAISTPLISYHEHNKRAREEQILTRIENGESVAIVSDAGMPAISDPGYELVQAAIEREYSVVVLPGANAALCALIGSGLPTAEFLFYGFLPRKKKDKLAELERLKTYPSTLLFYESPYRLKETLKVIQEALGERNIAIARELTKRFEEYIRGTVNKVIEWAESTELKGEFCIVVEGTMDDYAEQDLWWEPLSIMDHVNHYIEQENISSKDAIKRVAIDRNIPKREVYQVFHLT